MGQQMSYLLLLRYLAIIVKLASTTDEVDRCLGLLYCCCLAR